MKLLPPRVGPWWLACGLSLAVLAACGEPAETLSVAAAGAKLRTGLANTPQTWAFPENMSKDAYSRNAVLRQKLESMQKKGLLELVDEGQGWYVKLTPQGESFRMSHDPVKPDVKGEVIVRTGMRALDRVDSVGELQTNQGARVRDTLFTWHYSEVTPFGEALGLKPNQLQQSKSAAVLFGEDWRFVEQ